MLLDECFELADELSVPAAREVGIETALKRRETELLETRYLGCAHAS